MIFIFDNDRLVKMKCICLLMLFASLVKLSGQNSDYRHALDELNLQLSNDGYTQKDIDHIRISSAHQSSHNGVTHIYLQQYYGNLPIDGAIANMYILDNKTHLLNNAFISNVSGKIKSSNKSNISPEKALRSVLQHLSFPIQKMPLKIKKINDDAYEIMDKSISPDKITISLKYKLTAAGNIIEIWAIDLKSALSPDHWSIDVDAQSAEIINKVNYTQYCFSGNSHRLGPLSDTEDIANAFPSFGAYKSPSYLVYPVPIESPNHGNQSIETDPSDPIASPFGWHDTDGIEGPEYLITKGNNVHAFQDTADLNISIGDEPNGGEGLQFLYPHNKELSTQMNIEADVTNLFYWNNIMHDWTYRFGFTEDAGNFQNNNYNRGGKAQDNIEANTLDGQDISNASFSAPRDGTTGVMQMFKWVVGSNIEILNPENIAGFYPNGVAQFGPTINTDLIGKLIIAEDGIDASTDACQPILNNNLDGLIAVVDRGTCHFSAKVVNVQERGAIACIICNNIDGGGVIDMGAGDLANQVTIPSVMLSKEDCQLLKEALKTQEISVKLTNSLKEFSSSFDNAVIVHEYAHGLTIRLTGGASNSSCLNNDEQAGEGWSDFFALVMTHQYSERGPDSRGIATYLSGQDIDGAGIRRYRYSTDMTLNPQVFSHVRRTKSPHQLGEIWASTLWDMYWRFIDIYGYDPSWNDEKSGNYIAVQLVIDALKLQPCNPSLLESRDALLKADEINNQTANQCLIWETFARRGMGTDADNGSKNSRKDNKDGFSTPANCVPSINLKKEMAQNYSVGDELEVSLNIKNDDIQDHNNVVITDEIAQGIEFVSNLGDIQISHANNRQIEFTIPTLRQGQEIKIQYLARVSKVTPPDFSYFEGFENQSDIPLSQEGNYDAQWERSDTRAHQGLFSYKIRGTGGEGTESFTLSPKINSKFIRPGLKFWHRYDTELGIDGGLVEISQDGGKTWQTITKEKILINAYPDAISYDPLYKRQEPTFTGKSDWQPVLIDLSSFNLSDSKIRFKYIGQDFDGEILSEGWFIDDVEILDIRELISQTCVRDDHGLNICSVHKSYLNSLARTLPTLQKIEASDGIVIMPNPVESFLYLSFKSEIAEKYTVSIFTVTGQLMKTEQIEAIGDATHLNLNTSDLVAGTYIVAVTDLNSNKVLSERFIRI